MPAIDTMTAPLVLRAPDGVEKVIACAFTHPKGLLFLDLFWHHSSPDKAAHLIEGNISGEGPWKVGNHVIRVLGCHGTDPHLQPQFLPWQEYLENQVNEYPPHQQIIEIVKRLGATPDIS